MTVYFQASKKRCLGKGKLIHIKTFEKSFKTCSGKQIMDSVLTTA